VSLIACARAQDSPREKDDGDCSDLLSQPLARASSSLLVQLGCSLRTSVNSSILLRLLRHAARRRQAPTPSARTAPSAPSTPGGALRRRAPASRARIFRLVSRHLHLPPEARARFLISSLSSHLSYLQMKKIQFFFQLVISE